MAYYEDYLDPILNIISLKILTQVCVYAPKSDVEISPKTVFRLRLD